MDSKDSKKNKKIILGIAIALGVLTAGLGTVYADTAITGHNPMSGLVTAIATKFNLNPSDVQKVVDDQMAQNRATMEAQRQQDFANRLKDAVTAGKLTQAQADLITAKVAELKANEQSLQGKTPAEMQAAMKTQMDAIKQWATDNNIPLEYVMFGGFMKGGPRGMGMKGGFKHATSTQSTATAQQ